MFFTCDCFLDSESWLLLLLHFVIANDLHPKSPFRVRGIAERVCHRRHTARQVAFQMLHEESGKPRSRQDPLQILGVLRSPRLATDGAHDLPMARAIQAQRDAIAELARMSRHGASPNAERNPDARARELNTDDVWIRLYLQTYVRRQLNLPYLAISAHRSQQGPS